MQQDRKKVEAITPINEDFAQWYTDIVKKAELIDYSSVKGCVILRPYGYAIWELCQQHLDRMFKQTGHENVYLPMFIPESLLQKEKDHVDGFAPEVAWVTYGGSEELTERLCVRPTSETLFCEHYSHIIQSYRDLPKLYNQWCSVVRWEKTTRPFLRSREFLWQEGHTMHETREEAEQETQQMLKIYQEMYEKHLQIPVVAGKKTDSEKFAGAEATYTVEAMMHDGKSLQGGTSHFFGDGFARAFNITYTARDNTLQYPYQTSWGVSTRMLGAIIMTHGDDNGLILPPDVAPIQIVIVPIGQHKNGVLEEARRIYERLLNMGLRVKLDDGDQSPGWKFAQYEMKGIPLRIELGPRDLEQGNCVFVRRDTGEKEVLSVHELEAHAERLLESVRGGLYEKAAQNLAARSVNCADYSALEKAVKENPGFYATGWCGKEACEEKLKAQMELTSRCIPFTQETVSEKCVVCQEKSKSTVIWGKAY